MRPVYRSSPRMSLNILNQYLVAETVAEEDDRIVVLALNILNQYLVAETCVLSLIKTANSPSIY